MFEKVKIERIHGLFQIDVKRLHLPFTVSQPCPNCAVPWKWVGNRDHVEYPLLEVPENLYGYCSECDHEWEVNVVINVTMHIAEKS